MALERFAITRPDGRSNAQVILDYVRDRDPGTTFTFGELADELSRDSDREYGVEHVRQIVSDLYPRLLREQQRALHNVRGIGYRLAPAREHGRLAIDRKRRSDFQLKRGLDTLKHVRWEEMGDIERQAHEGQLMVMSALWMNQTALEARQAKIEKAIRSLIENNVQQAQAS
jgi:hypothetical protein